MWIETGSGTISVRFLSPSFAFNSFIVLCVKLNLLYNRLKIFAIIVNNQ